MTCVLGIAYSTLLREYIVRLLKLLFIGDACVSTMFTSRSSELSEQSEGYILYGSLQMFVSHVQNKVPNCSGRPGQRTRKETVYFDTSVVILVTPIFVSNDFYSTTFGRQ